MSNIPGDPRNSEILVTTRPTKADPWGEPVTLSSNVNSNEYEYTPYISTNGLSLFFSRGFSKAHVWVSRRSTITAPWGTARLFEPVNSGNKDDVWGVSPGETEFCMSFSEEDSTLYFTRGTDVFTYDYSLWQVEVTPILDLNGDSAINQLDLNTLQDHLGRTDNSLYDIAPIPFGDGVVDAKDLRVLREFLLPELAIHPHPINSQGNIPHDPVLSWESGGYAQMHDVYFGTDYDDVNDATMADSPYMGRQETSSFDPGQLHFSTTYYWRVDEVNGAPDFTVFKGDLWSFTVESRSVLIPGATISMTASSAMTTSTPDMIMNGSGLEGDTHSTNSLDMWLSASPDLSPWLMCEFNQAQKLDHMLIWNSNTISEGLMGWGLKDVNIEYSVNGVDWTGLGTFTISKAPGLSTYSEPQGIDFGLVQAKYVRMDILNNWGGWVKQYGVAEVQFYGLPVYAHTPVPASGSKDVLPNSVVTWRAGREASQHTIYVSADANAVADGLAPCVTTNTNSLDLTSLNLQLDETYYWRVDEVNETETPSLWSGPVWSFSTSLTLIVDDFERYSKFSPDRPFQTWLDGLGYSADQFLTVAYGGNGTGASLGHDIWNPSSPYFNRQIMETTRTIMGSNQSLPFYYTNTGGVASQIDRVWSMPQDWSGHGIQTLVLYFYGAAGNTGQLYAEINDIKIPYDGDASNLGKPEWSTWNIDLSSLDVTRVNRLSICIEGEGASGLLLFDDISLHTPASE
ncbi:MAG: discoidin domain-containing protein [Phycisphaerae bacterium]|nr:discoidin domain-containing protein [Phycisphaerae bacterium]